ncbi:MAG: TolC family protein [Myxococcales bacterium]|nr:TolC family protein [Myxococcales bacterium]
MLEASGSAETGPAPRGRPPGATSLEALLRFAEIHAPALRIARARVGLSDAALAAAAPLLPANPELSVATGLRDAPAGSGLDLQASLSQAFEIAGERGWRQRAAAASRQAALGRLEEIRWRVHVQVHRLLHSLLIASERRALADRFGAFAQSLHEIASRQVEAGEASRLILLVAEADRAQSQQAQIGAAQAEASLRIQLASVVGWPSGASLRVEAALPPVRPAPPIERLVALMQRHHPSLRARGLETRAARTALAREAAEGWPEPSLGVSYARESRAGAEPASAIWWLSLSMPLPLWDRNQGPRAAAAAELEIAEREGEALARLLRGELVGAALALDAAAAQVALYEETVVPRLEENLRLLERAYELGEADIHQVSQTRHRMLEAMSRYLDARLQYYAAAAQLEGRVGVELFGDELFGDEEGSR